MKEIVVENLKYWPEEAAGAIGRDAVVKPSKEEKRQRQEAAGRWLDREMWENEKHCVSEGDSKMTSAPQLLINQ
jgi:hypothetical protein